MNIRTLSKADTVHLVNLSCMVMALGVSSFYFDSAAAANHAVASLGDALLAPYYFAKSVSNNLFHQTLAGHPAVVFTVLWITYFLCGIRLSNFLIVKDHQETELKNWYFARKSHS